MKNLKPLFADFPQDTLFSALPPVLQQVHKQAQLAGNEAMSNAYGEHWYMQNVGAAEFATFRAAYEQAAEQPYPHHIDFHSPQNQCEHWNP